VLPEPLEPYGNADLPILWPSATDQPNLQAHGHGDSVSQGVPVYSPAYAGTKLYWLVEEVMCVCVCEQRDSSVAETEATISNRKSVQRPNHCATTPHNLERLPFDIFPPDPISGSGHENGRGRGRRVKKGDGIKRKDRRNERGRKGEG